VHKELWDKLKQLHQKLISPLEAMPDDAVEEPINAPQFPATYSAAQRRAIAECLPELGKRLKLKEHGVRKLEFTHSELRQIKKAARRAVWVCESGIKRNSLYMVIDKTCEALAEFSHGGIGHIPSKHRIFQLKISLVGVTPETWRRIQVKNCTLDGLHEHIQMTMGWFNSHLHQFDVDGVRYCHPHLLQDEFDFEAEDSTKTKLADIMPKDGKRFRFGYEYDFGDGWEHEILFEGCLQAEKGTRYPLCLEGARACPPEDIGGIWGYAEYLEAIANPKHERHDEFMEWGGEFDPEEFDAAETTRMIRQGMPHYDY